MLYMIVDPFSRGDPVPVYRRFRDRGRLAPEGLRYVSSWVSADFRRCYQLVECDDPKMIELWTANWTELVDFEVIQVLTSSEAVKAIVQKL